jgi:hypothetical protein
LLIQLLKKIVIINMPHEDKHVLLFIGAVFLGLMLYHTMSSRKHCDTFVAEPYPEWVTDTSGSSTQPAVNTKSEVAAKQYPRYIAVPPSQQNPESVKMANQLSSGGCDVPVQQAVDPTLIFKNGQVPRDYVVDDEVQAPAVLTSEDLLPVDDNNAWADVNPEGTGSLAYKNFLEAGHHIGQTQILRNADIGFRAEYPNPQANVGPWSQSTIVPNPHYSQDSDICV